VTSLAVMDASPSSSCLPGSSGRYAGVARYLASLEMAGSDLETPPGHPAPVTYARPDDERQATAGAAAKPEVNGDDVIQGSNKSPALRHRQQVVFVVAVAYFCAPALRWGH